MTEATTTLTRAACPWPAQDRLRRRRVQVSNPAILVTLDHEVGRVLEDLRDVLALLFGCTAFGDVLERAEHPDRLALVELHLPHGPYLKATLIKVCLAG